jgi:hypothetical protein
MHTATAPRRISDHDESGGVFVLAPRSRWKADNAFQLRSVQGGGRTAACLDRPRLAPPTRCAKELDHQDDEDCKAQ